jgi:hypothetical protein
LDTSLDEHERRAYISWLHSPSVVSEDEVESILAFKIARRLGTIPSRTLRVLRGVPGQDPVVVHKVEAFVAGEPSLAFVPNGDRRRITLAT